jgi:hypothetical protein
VEHGNDEELTYRARVPGPVDSTMLLLDSLLTLFRLFRSEAAVAMASLPQLFMLNLLRLPLYLLAWLSFAALVAGAAYALVHSLLLAIAVFFLQQVTLLLLLEKRLDEVMARATFRESRFALALMQRSWVQRWQGRDEEIP